MIDRYRAFGRPGLVPAGKPRRRPGAALMLTGPMLAGLVLAGCSTMPSMPRFGAAQTQPAGAGAARTVALATPADPVAAFAATAAPGTEAQVVLEGGRSARLRLLRAYNAASGRECREVLIGSGLDERSSLVCLQDGVWMTARPLLRSGSRRP